MCIMRRGTDMQLNIFRKYIYIKKKIRTFQGYNLLNMTAISVLIVMAISSIWKYTVFSNNIKAKECYFTVLRRFCFSFFILSYINSNGITGEHLFSVSFRVMRWIYLYFSYCKARDIYVNIESYHNLSLLIIVCNIFTLYNDKHKFVQTYGLHAAGLKKAAYLYDLEFKIF